MRVHLNGDTKAKGLHVEKRTDFDFFSWALWTMSGGTILQNFSDPLKQVAYEGNVLTVAGVINYNVSQGIYEITNPTFLTTGGVGNLFSILHEKFTDHVKYSIVISSLLVLGAWLIFS